MFSAEKLLGKIISETLGGSSSGTKGGGAGNSLIDSLTSGAGLMTAIGLGVGAFEALKDQKEKTATSAPMPPLPGSSASGTTAMPPPPPGGSSTQPPPPPIPPGEKSEKKTVDLSSEDVALRMIQVMIAAAHADGVLDEREEKAILDRLRGAELDNEEKMFVLDELHQPKSVSELTDGIEEPSTAKAMYMLATAAIEVDTEAERAWLDELGNHLGLSPEIRSFIEDQA